MENRSVNVGPAKQRRGRGEGGRVEDRERALDEKGETNWRLEMAVVVEKTENLFKSSLATHVKA